MSTFDIRLFTLTAVVSTALACLLIIFGDIVDAGKAHRNLKLKLALYFGSHIITGICFLLYFYNPSLFIWFNPLFMLTIVLVPLSLYAFIFTITAISPEEKFSKYHYLAPVGLCLIMLLLSIITPVEEQLRTIQGNGVEFGDSLLFNLFSNKLIFRLIFNVFYVVLSFRRLPRYRKYIINYSANDTKASLRWVSLLLFFIISLIMVPLYGLFISRSTLATSFVTFLQIGMLIIQYSFLTYHVLKGNYILQEASKSEEDTQATVPMEMEENSTEAMAALKKNFLDKVLFETFMDTHKPYLEPNLKITDLSEKLLINRTYISKFINTEYGVNFSNYINNLRLREYEQLRANDELKDKSNTELSEKAGFGSYRSYTRFAAIQKSESTVSS